MIICDPLATHNEPYYLNYVADLLNQEICLFRPGKLQAWAQLDGRHGGSVRK